MKKEDKTTIDLAVLANDIRYIKEDVSEIKRKLEAEYITKSEFEPIKKIVYGMVSILLAAVIGAIVKLVILP